jgi:hypothetical protein
VFDRLLATDKEIAETEEAMGVGEPIFRSPEEAGMTPEQWQDYLDNRLEARTTAQQQLEHRVLKDRLRETEAWWKEAEAVERKGAAKEYDALPASRAFRFLRTGDMVLDTPEGPTTDKGPRTPMDPQAAAYALGRSPTEKLQPLLKKGGIHPDEVAELFGYGTGRALLEALEHHPEKDGWVAQRTGELMAEKYPEVLQDKAKLRELASKGLHGEHTAKWLVREWEALKEKAYTSRTTGKKTASPTTAVFNPEANATQRLENERSAGVVPLESIRKAAKQLAEQSTIRKIDAGAALRAERQAAEDAAKAAVKGNFEQALLYKQKQLLNFYLGRELGAARELRDSFLELAKTLTEDKARRRLGKASPTYAGGVDLILEALGLKEPESREKPLPSLNEVVAQMEGDGATVMFDRDVVEKLLAQPGRYQPATAPTLNYRDLTVAQVREVHGALKNIQAAARAASTAILDGKRVEKEELVRQLVAEAEAHLPHLGPAVEKSARTGMEKLGGLASSLDGSLLKPETVVRWLGGDNLKSTWFRAIVQPLQDAKAREVDLLNKTVQPILHAFEALPKEAAGHMMDSIDGKALFPGHREDLAVPTKRYQLLMMALQAGNESNMHRLTEGRGITEEQVVAALNTLTKQEMDWVQTVWDANESLWPEARDFEERDSGLPPPKIEPKPLKLKLGTYAGGYFPAIYNRDVEAVGQKQVLGAIAALMDPSYTRPSTARSHLKSRVDEFSGAISLEPGAIGSHLAQVVHDIAYREALKSVGGLILATDVQKVLRDRLGTDRRDQFLQWLKDVGQMRGIEGATHAGALLQGFRAIRGNTVIAALGFAVPNMIEDLSNLVAVVPRTDLKAKSVLYGLGGMTGAGAIRLAELVKSKHLAAGLSALLGTPAETFRQAHEKSGELRTRRTQLQRELQRQTKTLTATGVFARKPFEWLKHHAFAFMEASDWATSTPIWVGAYRQALLEEGETPDAEANAIRKADATIRQVFPSHSPVDAAPILRDKGVMGATLMFYGFLNTYYNGMRDLSHELHTAEGPKETLKRVPKVGGRMLGYVLAVSVLSEFLRGRGREPDEDWAQWFLRKSLVGPLSAVPYGGDVGAFIDAKVLHRQYNPHALSLVGVGLAVVDSLAKLGQEIQDDGDKLDKKLEQALRALGTIAGLPTAQPLRTGRYLYDVFFGDRKVNDPLDFASGLIYGERDNQPANPLRPGGIAPLQ